MQYYPEEDKFPLEFENSQGFFFILSQSIVPWHCHLWLLISDLNLHLCF